MYDEHPNERYCDNLSHYCHNSSTYHNDFLFSGVGDEETLPLDEATAERYLNDVTDQNNALFGWR